MIPIASSRSRRDAGRRGAARDHGEPRLRAQHRQDGAQRRLPRLVRAARRARPHRRHQVQRGAHPKYALVYTGARGLRGQ